MQEADCSVTEAEVISLDIVLRVEGLPVSTFEFCDLRKNTLRVSSNPKP